MVRPKTHEQRTKERREWEEKQNFMKLFRKPAYYGIGGKKNVYK